MLIGISGKINSGKDLVGQLINYIETGGEETYISLEAFLEYYNDAYLEDGTCLYPYEIKKFADKLKEMVCMLIGCTRAQLEDREFKEKELGEQWWYWKVYSDILNEKFELIPYYGESGFYDRKSNYKGHSLLKLTPRKMLQLLGTQCGRQIIHPNIWVNALFADYNPPLYFMCDECMADNILPFEFTKNIKEDQCPKCKYISESNITQVINTNSSNWIITDVRFPNEAKAIKDRGGIVIRVDRPCKECGGMGYHKMDCNIGRCEHESEWALDDYEEFDYVIENNGTIEELLQKVKNII